MTKPGTPPKTNAHSTATCNTNKSKRLTRNTPQFDYESMHRGNLKRLPHSEQTRQQPKKRKNRKRPQRTEIMNWSKSELQKTQFTKNPTKQWPKGMTTTTRKCNRHTQERYHALRKAWQYPGKPTQRTKWTKRHKTLNTALKRNNQITRRLDETGQINDTLPKSYIAKQDKTQEQTKYVDQ